MARAGRSRREQRELRRRRGERAFLFDQGISRCLGDVAREEFEAAVSICGGDVAEAAAVCGVPNLPRGAKALWGRSAAEARATYRRWQNRRKK